MKENSIFPEIRKFIADKIASGETIAVDWLTHEIIAKKQDISGDDTEFYRVCAYTHVRDVVKRCVGKYNARTQSDEQLVMDGFEHLQVAYTVQRHDEIVLVPVDQLTAPEIEARAQEYEHMGLGCFAHAKELRSYALARAA
jgi:hypothetical protein